MRRSTFGRFEEGCWMRSEARVMQSAPDLPEYYSTHREDFLRFIPSNFTRVLEVGCGGGGFSEKLLRNGAEVWGIEPNTAAARVAGTKLTKVFNATFEGAASDLPDNYFDLVVCNDVIEHMP